MSDGVFAFGCSLGEHPADLDQRPMQLDCRYNALGLLDLPSASPLYSFMHFQQTFHPLLRILSEKFFNSFIAESLAELRSIRVFVANVKHVPLIKIS